MAESVRNLHLVLFIGVLCVVQTLAQICPYSDPRCTCDEYSITCNNLQQMPPLNTGVNVSRIAHLSFQDGDITTISNNSLPPGLTSIGLVNNPFTNISDDAFDASADTLHMLYISRVKLNTLPTALKKLTKLTHLSISGTVIQDWDTATLKQIAATLDILELSDVGLTSWPSWISDFHLLATIDFRFSSFISIPDDAFNSSKDSLKQLYLSSNGLTQVPHALSILSNLETLFLSYNNIANVSEIEKITRFPFAQNLTYLYLVTVGLTTTANFSNLTSLWLLSLSGNIISEVPAGSLPASLTLLDFRDNRLSSVPQDVASMSQLSSVYLSSNLIKVIEPNTFPPNLTNLDLSYNNITIITNSTFRNLNLLDTLYLNDNPISTISPSAFSDLASLQLLRLTNSHLTEIPLAFAQLSPQTYTSLTTTQSLSCPCPTPPELVQWFASLTYNWLQFLFCSNGQSVTSYLSGQCGQPTATP